LLNLNEKFFLVNLSSIPLSSKSSLLFRLNTRYLTLSNQNSWPLRTLLTTYEILTIPSKNLFELSKHQSERACCCCQIPELINLQGCLNAVHRHKMAYFKFLQALLLYICTWRHIIYYFLQACFLKISTSRHTILLMRSAGYTQNITDQIKLLIIA